MQTANHNIFRSHLLLLASTFGAAALYVLVLLWWPLYHEQRLLSEVTPVASTIVAVANYDPGMGGEVSYRPVVSYTTASGQVMRVAARQGSTTASEFVVGQPLNIVYDPADPNYVLPASLAPSNGLGLGLLGVALLLGGLLCFGYALDLIGRRQNEVSS